MVCRGILSLLVFREGGFASLVLEDGLGILVLAFSLLGFLLLVLAGRVLWHHLCLSRDRGSADIFFFHCLLCVIMFLGLD